MRSRFLVILTVLAMVSATLAGCASPQAEATEAPTAAPAEPTAPAATEVPGATENEYGRTIVSLIPSDPSGLEPGFPAPFILHDIYSTLIAPKFDYDTGLLIDNEFVPDLAESWEVTPDNKSVTFHLNKNAKFWDGSPVTTADVYWSYERLLVGLIGGAVEQLYVGAINSIDQLEVIDEHTIRFNYPDGMNRFSMRSFYPLETSILSKAYGEAHATPDDPYASKTYTVSPMGSGPYKFVSWERGVSIVLEAWKDYWGAPKPYFEKIIHRIVPDSNSRMLLLASGEADLARNLSGTELKQLEGEPKVKVVKYPQFAAVSVLRMNPTVPPLDDPNIRKAIIKAIPYDAIVEDVMQGFGLRIKNLIGKTTNGYTENPLYETDLDEAKRLVQESKYAGSPIKFTMITDASSPEINDSAVLIQANLREIGIDMTIQKMPEAAFVELGRKKDGQQMPINIRPFGPLFNDALYTAYWHFSFDSPRNYTGYNNPDLTQAIEDGLKVPPEDIVTYDKLLKIVFDDILIADYIAAPLYQPVWTYAVASDIINVFYMGGGGFKHALLRSSEGK